MRFVALAADETGATTFRFPDAFDLESERAHYQVVVVARDQRAVESFLLEARHKRTAPKKAGEVGAPEVPNHATETEGEVETAVDTIVGGPAKGRGRGQAKPKAKPKSNTTPPPAGAKRNYPSGKPYNSKEMKLSFSLAPLASDKKTEVLGQYDSCEVSERCRSRS